ncbi:carcinoembryonic antigen-related cell adhesion molecule 1-like [Archocentrus centrarchus]|uniref:carcinoembryonic antigen-related cell adhesion molecule 1-like n=1 Tax=Archocentrus centrarchus TaxID=63155 RepID=UPI0011EA129B|nr:carcinoembryonic antigen-related cell adhesion molecule 1-like [Archocentrus centrarchus]
MMKMRPSDAPIVWLGWFVVFLAAVSETEETLIYGKVGGEVVLRPPAGSVTEPIKQILWTEGVNKAMEWDGAGMPVDAFRHFKGRCQLNTSTGEMTIRGLLPNDSKSYTPEINNKVLAVVHLIVLFPVSVPTAIASCDESTCDLTCKGNTTGADPVTYTWTSDNNVVHNSSENQYTVHKENISSSNEFICEMKNPVSQERSDPVSIAFISPPERGPKISTGITVLAVLLAAVLLLVAFHKWKTGTWFFDKDSMPWEADFWRKSEAHRREAPASNGTSAQHNENAEEETPMKTG